MKAPIPQQGETLEPPPSSHKRPWYRSRWFIIIAAIAVIIALSIGALVAYTEASERAAEEERAAMISAGETEAAEVCEEKIFDYAKYPAAAKLAQPIETVLRETEYGQGPAGTTLHSVNFGEAHFVNGFGVPVEYDFGCVTYHNQLGNILSTQVGVREKGLFSSYSYAPHSDSLG